VLQPASGTSGKKRIAVVTNQTGIDSQGVAHD